MSGALMRSSPRALARRGRPPALTSEMIALTLAIERAQPNEIYTTNGRVVQFMSPYGGEGTSTIVSELARVSALELSRSVLVLDGNAQHGVAGQFDPSSLHPPGTNGTPKLETVGNLAAASFDLASTYRAALASQDRGRKLFTRAREQFDLTLIDSPPALSSVEPIAIASLVDAVVLVVERRTSRRAINRVQREVERVGGQVVGAVFNRAQFALPEWLLRFF